MASKKIAVRIAYNAPFALTFSLLTAAIFLLDNYVFKQSMLALVFTSRASQACTDEALRFAWKNPADYLRLFAHVFGHGSKEQLLASLLLILATGPQAEERYGTAIICVMAAVAAFVSGILNACFVPAVLCGASSIVCLLVLLSVLGGMQDGELRLSSVLLFLLFIGGEVLAAQDWRTAAVHAAGGACGSLFAFLARPAAKKRRASPYRSSSSISVSDISSSMPD